MVHENSCGILQLCDGDMCDGEAHSRRERPEGWWLCYCEDTFTNRLEMAKCECFLGGGREVHIGVDIEVDIGVFIEIITLFAVSSFAVLKCNAARASNIKSGISARNEW